MGNNLYLDRYEYTTKLNFKNDFPDMYSIFRKVVFKEDSVEQYYRVTEVDMNRLDIISERFYGTPYYWWVIAMANNIIDPFYVPIGVTMKIGKLRDFTMAQEWK